MTHSGDIVVILGSGPNAPEARRWPRAWFDRIVTINNAWRLRPDWDDMVFPEDFPESRRPAELGTEQRYIQSQDFVPALNAFGGVVFAGGTMAFSAGYWALHAYRPRVLAFMGCDMVYPTTGPTHYYGTGTADPLRDDVTLQDLGAKSARLALLAADQGCTCVNLSSQASTLMFERAQPGALRDMPPCVLDTKKVGDIRAAEAKLGYAVPSGRYWEELERFDATLLAQIDAQWRAALTPARARSKGSFAA